MDDSSIKNEIIKILISKFLKFLTYLRWLMRTRIRIQMEGQNLQTQPIELHDQVLNNLEHRFC